MNERAVTERALWRIARALWRTSMRLDRWADRLVNLAWHAQHRADRRRDLAWGGAAWTGQHGDIPF